jgi:hypothetical protein
MIERSGPLIVSRGVLDCLVACHSSLPLLALARATHAPKGSLSRAIMEDPAAVLILAS